MATHVASHSGCPERTRTTAQRDVFLSPRIIDEGALRRYGDELRELAQTLDEKARTLVEAVARSHRARKDLEELVSKEAAGTSRINTLLESLASKTASIETALDRAGHIAGLSAGLEATSDRIRSEFVSSLEGRMAHGLDDFSQQVGRQVDLHTERVDEMLGRVRDSREQIGRQVEQTALRTLSTLREQCDRAEQLATGQLDHMIARAQEVRGQAELAGTSLDTSEKRAERLRRKTTQAIESACTFVDGIQRQRDDLEQGLTTATHTANEVRQALADDLTLAQQATGDVGEQRRQLEPLLAQATDQLSRAERAGSALVDPTVRAEAVADRLESLLERLEPLREILGGHAQTGMLPEPVSQLVTQMRRDRTSDLAAMAKAMSGISQRAGDTSGDAQQARGAGVVVRPQTEPAWAPAPPLSGVHGK